MGVHIAQAAQAVGSGAKASDVGQEDALVITDHDVSNGTLAVNQHADLAIEFLRQFAEVAPEFLSDDLLRRYFAAVDVLKTPDLVRFQPCDVAVYALNCVSPLRGSSGGAHDHPAPDNRPWALRISSPMRCAASRAAAP